MRITPSLAVLLLVSIPLTAHDPPAAPSDLVAQDQLDQLGYYEYWQAHLPLGEGEYVRAMFRVDENLYIATSRAVLYALHADVGVIRWAAELGGPGNRIFAPCHVRGMWGRDLVLVSTTDRLSWLDRTTGKSVFEFLLDFIPCSPAVSDGIRVYVAGLDELMHCYNFVPSGVGTATLLEAWRIRTGNVVVAPAVLWGGDLFFASRDGYVRVCGSHEKGRKWVYNVRAPVEGGLFVDGTGVYFGAMDRSVYALDASSGFARWRYRTPGLIRRPPIVIGQRVYQCVDHQGVYVLNADGGELVWHAPTARDFVCSTDDHTFLTTRFGDILAVHPDTGEVQAEVYAGDVAFVLPNASSGAMYLAGSGGAVLCAQEKNVPYLRFEQIQARIDSAAQLPSSGEPEKPAIEVGSRRSTLVDLLRSKSQTAPLGG